LAIFQQNGYSDHSLASLNEQMINDVLGNHGRLVTCSFYNALSLWKRDNVDSFLEVEEHTDVGGSIVPSGFKNRFKRLNIELVLSDDFDGQRALDYYKKNKKLNDTSRTNIIHSLIRYMVRTKIWIEKEQFTDLTEDILNHFKT
jgi:hypothetical protein